MIKYIWCALFLAVILGACKFSCSSYRYEIKSYIGEVIHIDGRIDNSTISNYRYSVGIKLEDGDTKLFKASRPSSHKKNYRELERIYTLHKLSDKITVHWYEQKKYND